MSIQAVKVSVRVSFDEKSIQSNTYDDCFECLSGSHSVSCVRLILVEIVLQDIMEERRLSDVAVSRGRKDCCFLLSVW